MLVKSVVYAFALMIIAGCASKPIIDPKGVNMVKYDQDLNECDAYADQVEVTKRAAGGPAGGAVASSDQDRSPAFLGDPQHPGRLFDGAQLV